MMNHGGSATITIDLSDYNINFESNKITFSTDGETKYTMDYTLDNSKAAFSLKYSGISTDLSNIITVSYLSIADISGINLDLAYTYFTEKYNDSLSNNDGSNFSITDDVFNYTIKSDLLSGSEYNLEVNLDNFSNVNSIEKKSTVTILDNTNNNNTNTNSDENTVIEEEILNSEENISSDEEFLNVSIPENIEITNPTYNESQSHTSSTEEENLPVAGITPLNLWIIVLLFVICIISVINTIRYSKTD